MRSLPRLKKMRRIDITTTPWNDYELLDSGAGAKLERFGNVILDRPDPQALWSKSNPTAWLDAHASFVWADKGQRWKVAAGTPESWTIQWQDVTLGLSLKGFKHIGMFPEHAHQWQELQALGKKHTGLTMLNLFGYTGAASVAAALTGMQVTHVDASKSTIETVKENAVLSGLAPDALRTICEDALRYTKRLVARGEKFDVIVMDPPAFGRGPKGEVWKIEESLAELVSLLPQLLSPSAKLVILNGYAAGYGARTFGELFADVLPSGEVTYGDVGIAQVGTEKVLTTGIYAKWQP
jgi:23S rRNA (cytosine1962-C5)-methyltransferase